MNAARNAGLELMGGHYVAFLNADDTWSPISLEKLLSALNCKADAMLACCSSKNVGLSPISGRYELKLPQIFMCCSTLATPGWNDVS